MQKSRRNFLVSSSLALLSAAVETNAQTPAGQNPALPPGAPPAFGTAAPVGPEVSAKTFAEAERLVAVEMTAADKATAASNWRNADGAPLRTPHWPAQACNRSHSRACHAMESIVARNRISKSDPILHA